MNTIQITTVDGAINYTESEILRFINKAGELDEAQQASSKYRTETYSIRNKVRDFFSEREWSDRETTVNLDEVNELLNSIGSHVIQSTYSGNITISLTFCDLEADNADDAINRIEDEITVDLDSASITIDQVNVDDIEEQ
jgi:hypothetical protein